MNEDLRWLASMKSNQAVISTSRYETVATSTEPKTASMALNGSFALITAAGADHFVDFEKDATTSSLVVPQGQTVTFEIHDLPEGIQVSVRTATGTGFVTISDY